MCKKIFYKLGRKKWKKRKTWNSWLMVYRRQVWKTDEKRQSEMTKHDKTKDDRRQVLKKDDTMMAGKKDKRFVGF